MKHSRPSILPRDVRLPGGQIVRRERPDGMPFRQSSTIHNINYNDVTNNSTSLL